MKSKRRQQVADAMAKVGKVFNDLRNATEEGMREAVLFIEGESLELVPVDFGFLKNSSFTQVTENNISVTGTVGYTAKYAAYVHEAPMTLKGKPRKHFGQTSNNGKFGPKQVVKFGGGSGRGHYWDSGENKFLEKAFFRNVSEIKQILVRHNATVLK